MMERKHLHGITLLGGLAMALLCGCIRDELEPCPPLRLSLEVADKNYAPELDLLIEDLLYVHKV